MQSVRARTTLVATLAVGVAFAVAAFGLLVMLRRSLIANVDEVADVRAEDVAALTRQGLLPRRLAAPGDEDALVQVVDADRRVVAGTPNAPRRPVTTFAPPGSDGVARTIRGVPGTQGHDVRVFALRSGSSVVYVVTSLEPVDETMGTVRGMLWAGGPALFLLVALVTWLVVGRALRPVTAIRREAADITATDLSRRVPEPGVRDEIGLLARTINDMLERIERSSERQRRFVADASHELQTPLAAARADLEVALAHPESADWTSVASGLLEDNRRMERLVQNLLFLARAGEGRPMPPMVPVDLDDVVLGEVARSGGTAAIDVSGVSAAPVLGRRDDLVRLVRNIVDNAQRHAARRVVLQLHSVDGEAVLTVSDDGPGIPPAERERVFERFTRLDDARSNGDGAGLGLAIAREIAAQHGGWIAVEDAAEGGARFVVRLPNSRV